MLQCSTVCDDYLSQIEGNFQSLVTKSFALASSVNCIGQYRIGPSNIVYLYCLHLVRAIKNLFYKVALDLLTPGDESEDVIGR